MFKVNAYKTNMKLPKIKRLSITRRLSIVTVLAVASVLVTAFSVVPQVLADRFDEQINELRDQNAGNQSALSALKVEASSFQDAINKLQAQINTVQAQINENVAKQNDLQAKIEESQRELDRQRGILGENIRVMYVEGQITTIEMLATSKNLSEFVDREEYRTAVKNKIQETLKKITKLQNELKEQKVQVERLLAEQKAQQTQLDYSRSEQTRLLTFNQSQQADYNAKIKDNNAKIADLKRQQVIENLKLFGNGSQPGIAGGGGYPWGNAYCVHTGKVSGDCPNYDWYFNGNPWDPWGYGYRNCTSWVGFKLAADGKSGISNLGNANQWPGRARARGFSVTEGQGAKVGDAAVSMSGYYGHVMYVEAILDDGRVMVSDYNRGGDGLYREGIRAQSGLVFIHF